ncbi:hypothetical protein K3148_00945 [Qipengyuania aurantiaca]|uniref:Lipoprotein n=1 Tax=Qipengyuania aurantiaca TaxID=2867233 RepID=A0ABX8ZQJ2_9SPHN|nr:hypothetical protein [Qipengyuania aurantiaca]QZD90014.1 hypothetical protein K3148_00945 [Qipengyuania aurantiaca]
MNKALLPVALAGTVLLGGCATYGNGGLLGDILGGGDTYGYNGGNDLERRAAEACGREASRFGRAEVTRVDQQDRDYLYVYGRIDTRDYNRDEFTCVYRSDGRIVDFQTR